MPNRIRIMHVVYSLQIGGSEKLALDIASHVDPSRFHFSVCALDRDGDLTRDLESRSIRHHVMNHRGFEPGLWLRLHRLFKTDNIDLVHTHHFSQLFYAGPAARFAGARVVHTEHDFWSYANGAPLARALIRPLSQLCDYTTVVGPEVADYFVRRLGLRRDRVRTVPNGVDLQAFDHDSEAVRRELGFDSTDVIIGTVGRLEPEKDQATLLKVLQQLTVGHPSLRLMIVGTGSLAEQLVSHAARIGVSRQVAFLGARRDVPRLLSAMDVFVLPSVREGLPISLIEAMAARRAVVASDVGSVRHLIRDGDNGFVLPAQDVAAFTNTIAHLICTPELRRRVGDAGRRTVEESFSLSAMTRAYEDLYQTVAMKEKRVDRKRP